MAPQVRLVQAVYSLVRRVVHWDRAHFNIMMWKLILEPYRCFQSIRKTAISRFCMSIDLKDKILVRHVMSCAIETNRNYPHANFWFAAALAHLGHLVTCFRRRGGHLFSVSSPAVPFRCAGRE